MSVDHEFAQKRWFSSVSKTYGIWHIFQCRGVWSEPNIADAEGKHEAAVRICNPLRGSAILSECIGSSKAQALSGLSHLVFYHIVLNRKHVGKSII